MLFLTIVKDITSLVYGLYPVVTSVPSVVQSLLVPTLYNLNVLSVSSLGICSFSISIYPYLLVFVTLIVSYFILLLSLLEFLVNVTTPNFLPDIVTLGL